MNITNLPTTADELSSRTLLPGSGTTGTDSAQAQTATGMGLGADPPGPSQAEIQPPEEDLQSSDLGTPPSGNVGPTARAQQQPTPGSGVETSDLGRQKPAAAGFSFAAPASTSTVGGFGSTLGATPGFRWLASEASHVKPAAPGIGSFTFNLGGTTGATGAPPSGGPNLFGGHTAGAATTPSVGSANQANPGASVTPGTGNLIFNLYGGSGSFTFEINLGGGTTGAASATSAPGAGAGGLFSFGGSASATTTAGNSQSAATGFGQRPTFSFSQPRQAASLFGSSGIGGGSGAPAQPGAFGGSGFGAGPSSAGGFGAPGGFGAAVPVGTTQPVFQPLETTEKDAKTGKNIRSVYYTIGMMPQYKAKSAEELRSEDYQANLKGPQAGTGFGAAAEPFGATGGFGQQPAAAPGPSGAAQPAVTPVGKPPPVNSFGSLAQPIKAGLGAAQPAALPGPFSGSPPAAEALYRCSICCEDMAESKGILCKAKKNKRHFLCKGCFSGFVARQVEYGLFDSRQLQGPDYPIYCCMAPHCEARHPAKDLAFTAREVALMSTEESYGMYLRLREQDAMTKGRAFSPPVGTSSFGGIQSQAPKAIPASGAALPSPFGQTQIGPGAAPSAPDAALSTNGTGFAFKPTAPVPPGSFSFTLKAPAPSTVAKPPPVEQPQQPVFASFLQLAQQQQQQNPGSNPFNPDPPVLTFGQKKPATTSVGVGAPVSSTPNLFGSAFGTTPQPTAPTTTPSFKFGNFGGATQATQAKPATSGTPTTFTFNWGVGTTGATGAPASGGLNLFGGSATGGAAAPALVPSGTTSAAAAGASGAGGSAQRKDVLPAAQQQQQTPGASSATSKSVQQKPATTGSPVVVPSKGQREADPSSPRPANSGLAPRLTMKGYSTVPPLEELWRYSSDQLAKIEEFTIKCKGLGEVRFLSDTDVRGLDLDAIVDFHSEPGNLRMYMQNEEAKPEVDKELNKRAQVTLYNVKKRQPGEDSGKTESEFNHVHVTREILRAATLEFGGEFIGWDPETGTWTFIVDHFSRYGLALVSD